MLYNLFNLCYGSDHNLLGSCFKMINIARFIAFPTYSQRAGSQLSKDMCLPTKPLANLQLHFRAGKCYAGKCYMVQVWIRGTYTSNSKYHYPPSILYILKWIWKLQCQINFLNIAFQNDPLQPFISFLTHIGYSGKTTPSSFFRAPLLSGG